MRTAFACSLPISSRTGAIMRQGPDQLAKKATRTGTFESLTDSSAISFLFLLLVRADSFTSIFGVAQYYIGYASHAFLAYSDGFGLTRLIIRFFYW
jgi:hypothetical protein